MLPTAQLAVDLGLELHDLLANHEVSVDQVDVVPPEPSGLTPSKTGHGDQLEDRRVRVGGCVVQEPAQLLGLPRVDLGTGLSWNDGVLGHVGGQRG